MKFQRREISPIGIEKKKSDFPKAGTVGKGDREEARRGGDRSVQQGA